MIEAVIGLGSNIGDGRGNIIRAWELLGEKAGVNLKGLSSPYLSEPVGMDSQNWFTNCVGCLETNLAPEKVLTYLLETEEILGRYRPEKSEKPVDRIVDLDLLFFGDQVINSPNLIIPHPEIPKRLFVLMPLAELLPNQYHPVLGLTASQMLKDILSAKAVMKNPKEVKRIAWK